MIEPKKTPPQKIFYDVVVETMLPAKLTYRVFADDPEQAATMIKNMRPNSIKHNLMGRRDSKLMVCLAGSSIVKLVKQLLRR